MPAAWFNVRVMRTYAERQDNVWFLPQRYSLVLGEEDPVSLNPQKKDGKNQTKSFTVVAAGIDISSLSGA
jgi:hypothetical protein